MSGLRRICKLYGGMVIQGVKWSWDYAADEPVLASEMPIGSARHMASERAKYTPMTNAAAPAAHAPQVPGEGSRAESKSIEGDQQQVPKGES